MPPVRVRIRTLMIAVAALAVLMRMVSALNGPFQRSCRVPLGVESRQAR
jgi:hypothetical protein